MRNKRAKQLRRMAKREAAAEAIMEEAGLYDEPKAPLLVRLRTWWHSLWIDTRYQQRRNKVGSERYSHRFLKRFYKERRRHGDTVH